MDGHQHGFGMDTLLTDALGNGDFHGVGVGSGSWMDAIGVWAWMRFARDLGCGNV